MPNEMIMQTAFRHIYICIPFFARCRSSYEVPECYLKCGGRHACHKCYLARTESWHTLKMLCSLGRLRILTPPYMWFNHAVINFLGFSQQEDRFVSLKQVRTLFKFGTLLLVPDNENMLTKKQS